MKNLNSLIGLLTCITVITIIGFYYFYQHSLVPSFSGSIGAIEENDKLLEFLNKHDQETVYLDLSISIDEQPKNKVPKQFESTMQSPNNFFLWEDCATISYTNTLEGEPEYICTGVEVNLETTFSTSFYNTAYGYSTLRGYWIPIHYNGLRQGNTFLKLWGVPVSSVALLKR